MITAPRRPERTRAQTINQAPGSAGVSPASRGRQDAGAPGWHEAAFKVLGATALWAPIAILGILFASALYDAWPRLTWDFLTSFPSRRASAAGILPALAGSFWLLLLTAALAIPVGIGAALYMEEYARPSRLTAFIELNLANLAGVPSILYGLLGLEIFVRSLGMGRSLLAGAATLALLLLPMVVMTSREALRAVPAGLREAAAALGAERWRILFTVVLPMALPATLTGIILALARAIGETAPLITIGALTFVAFLPDSPGSEFTALPIQIFNWVSRPQEAFHANAAAGIVVLLGLLLSLNAAAIALRNKLQRRADW
jgi:phosphate transport system permease protein